MGDPTVQTEPFAAESEIAAERPTTRRFDALYKASWSLTFFARHHLVVINNGIDPPPDAAPAARASGKLSEVTRRATGASNPREGVCSATDADKSSSVDS